jgi:cyclopropane fatty-acyl-phospholipid synthase-like methyltransferase
VPLPQSGKDDVPYASFGADEIAAYYNNAVVSEFYQRCWGGADIHIGRYATGDETIAEASAAMTQHLLELAGLAAGQRVLDIACGFGGTLRTLARLGCQAKGIDISKSCVDHAREANTDAGLADQIEVAVGDFHSIDSAPDSWDVVVCQEALIHSPNRPRVFTEVWRVLRPGGVFAFSDILTAEAADIARVGAAFSRLGASPGATVNDYLAMARAAGFEISHVEERLRDIATHYDKLAALLAKPVAGIDSDALAAISQSISQWQDALAGGHITWACFVARKPL